MHGIGVNTPNAAEVAAATVGFAIEVHTPNGIIFVIGIWSIIFASGTIPVKTLFAGSTTRELGATPKLHCIIAPIQTCIGILASPRSCHLKTIGRANQTFLQTLRAPDTVKAYAPAEHNSSHDHDRHPMPTGGSRNVAVFDWHPLTSLVEYSLLVRPNMRH